MIQFIKEHIIHRFRIPQSITTDQGTMFTREEMNYSAPNSGIQLIISTLFLCSSQQTSRSFKQSVDRNPRENSRGESHRLAQDFIIDIVGL